MTADIGDSGPEGGGGDFPWFPTTIGRWPRTPQYYGDSVRGLLLAAAALMLLASPLYGDNLHVEFTFEVVGALVAAACAALTNPRDRWVSLAGTVVSGVGVTVYAVWGISGYDPANPVAFALRVAIALLFLFAFYFSVTTVRSFAFRETREPRNFIEEVVEVVQESPEEINEGYEEKKIETSETWIDQ